MEENNKTTEQLVNEAIEQKVNEVQENVDAFEVAANMTGLYTPKFELLVKKLSTGQLRRLVNALVTYPLNEKDFIENCNSDELKNAFLIGDRLLQCKMLMIEHMLMEQMNATNKENENVSN